MPKADWSPQEIAALQKEVLELRRQLSDQRTTERGSVTWAQLLDQIHDAVIETDLRGRIVRWNRGAQSLYGYSAHEALGKHVSFLYPPHRREAMQKEVLDVLLKTGAYEAEGTRMRKDGVEREVHVSLSLLRNDAGEPYGMIGYSIDITDHRRAEEMLRRSEARYRTVVETTGTGYVVINSKAMVLDANAEYVRLTGRSSLHDVIGHSVMEWTAPHDLNRNQSEVAATTTRGFVRHFEIDYINPTGGFTPVEVNATVFEKNDEQIIIGLCRDISERRRAAEMQQRLLSEVDHRVRNNLASLSALIDISRQNKKTVPDFAATIQSRVQAMATVHSLLSRTRWQPVDVCELVRMILPEDLHGCIELEGPKALIASRQATAMGMMFQELFANSMKYGSLSRHDGKIRIAWKTHFDVDGCRMHMDWKETGGPPLLGEPIKGQGSMLIRGFVQTELRGNVELRYPQTGAHHTFDLLLDLTDAK